VDKHVFLIRHCTFSGQAADAALAPEGYRQAANLTDRLADAGIERIVSSPYRRARETIAPLATRLGLAIEIDARIRERELSPTPIENWRDVVARSFVEPEFCVPGGESGHVTLARGWAALDAVFAGSSRITALVSHGQISSLLLHHIGPPFGYDGWLRLSNPDVYRITRDDTGALSYHRIWS